MIFVATDQSPMTKQLTSHLKDQKVSCSVQDKYGILCFSPAISPFYVYNDFFSHIYRIYIYITKYLKVLKIPIALYESNHRY